MHNRIKYYFYLLIFSNCFFTKPANIADDIAFIEHTRKQTELMEKERRFLEKHDYFKSKNYKKEELNKLLLEAIKFPSIEAIERLTDLGATNLEEAYKSANSLWEPGKLTELIENKIRQNNQLIEDQIIELYKVIPDRNLDAIITSYCNNNGKIKLTEESCCIL